MIGRGGPTPAHGPHFSSPRRISTAADTPGRAPGKEAHHLGTVPRAREGNRSASSTAPTGCIRVVRRLRPNRAAAVRPTILRTETAALVAASAILALAGRLA
jgi:16S rRNA U1498 N3-methylase RsmE